MALIGNRSVLHKSPGRFLSGTAGTLRSGFNKPGMLAGRFETMDALSAALPGGHLSPSAWSLPRTAGGMSSINAAALSLDGAGLIVGGITATGAADFLLTFADADILPLDDTSPARTGAAMFTISVADAAGSLITSAEGTAAFSFAALAELLGILQATGATTLTLSTNTPLLGADAGMAGDATLVLTASANALPADDTPPARTAAASFSFGGSMLPYAIGSMEGSTDVATVLTADAVASAVWGYSVDTGVTAQEAIQLLLAAGGSLTVEQATRLEELWKMAGLDPAAPVTATKTRRYAGDSVTPDIDQTITGNGRTTSTITRE